jgi:hypothetical protein
LIDSCRKSASLPADALLGGVLSLVEGEEGKWQALCLDALDAGRAMHAGMPAHHMLMGMFTSKVKIAENEFEITEKSCNSLRKQLYQRAKADGNNAYSARCILASLECIRRKGARPNDELRHPEPNDGVPWTNSLVFQTTA